MRFQGKIKSWNQAKGFGFITQNGDGKEVFVHISEFNKIHQKPTLNSLVTYEIGQDEKNRQRALNIKFVGEKVISKKRHLNLESLFSLFIFGLILFLVTDIYKHRGSTIGSSIYKSVYERDYKKSDYSCDGKTHCSEMSSCGEALFYQENCGRTEMDGDYDGIPCEKQWCN